MASGQKSSSSHRVPDVNLEALAVDGDGARAELEADGGLVRLRERPGRELPLQARLRLQQWIDHHQPAPRDSYVERASPARRPCGTAGAGLGTGGGRSTWVADDGVREEVIVLRLRSRIRSRRATAILCLVGFES